jgi:hypothetical protein
VGGEGEEGSGLVREWDGIGEQRGEERRDRGEVYRRAERGAGSTVILHILIG